MGSEIYGGPNRGVALSKVNGPAIGLMVIGGLGVAWHLFSLVMNVIGTGLSLPNLGGNQAAADRAMQAMSGGLGIVFAIIGIAASGLVIFGAMKMRALTGYGLALASAIVAMVPGLTCWCCCFGLPGLPIGIWALVVLLDQNVKASFV